MSTFAIYAIGFAILIAGLAYAAVLLGVPSVWIGVGVLVLAGIGIISGATSTRRKDAPEASQPE